MGSTTFNFETQSSNKSLLDPISVNRTMIFTLSRVSRDANARGSLNESATYRVGLFIIWLSTTSYNAACRHRKLGLLNFQSVLDTQTFFTEAFPHSINQFLKKTERQLHPSTKNAN